MDSEQSKDLGIIKELGDLPADTVVSEQALAKLFNRHRVSIKRAIERGELPPSVRLFGELDKDLKAAGIPKQQTTAR